MELKTIVSKRLIEYRKIKKLTQHAMANKLGISQQAYQGYENPNIRTMPKLEDFVKIAKILNVSYEYLLGESNANDKENIGLSKEIGLSDIAINTLSQLKEKSKTDENARIKLDFINQLFCSNGAEELLNGMMLNSAIQNLHQQEREKLDENPVHIGTKESVEQFLAVQNLAFSDRFESLCVERLKRFLLPDQRFINLFDGVNIIKYLNPYLSKQKKTYRKWAEWYETLEEMANKDEL